MSKEDKCPFCGAPMLIIWVSKDNAEGQAIDEEKLICSERKTAECP